MTLIADDVHVEIGGRALLAGIDVRFERAALTAIVGPNGAGKSTLLSCLAGFRAPDRGEVRLDGRPIRAMRSETRARRLAVLPQGGEVHWNVLVQSLVALGRAPWRGSHTDAAGVDPVDDAMAAVDIAHLAEREALTLSGGERGRALLARALAVGAPWLLADEPLPGLDPLHQLTALAALRGEAARGRGVLLVIHDLSLAARFADRVLVLHEGRIVADGAPQAVLTEALLRDVYGVEAHVGRTPDGGLFVQPIAPVR